MASTINASTSPAAIVQTADGTANLSLQSNGTTIAALTSTGMAVTGTLSASGVITATGGIVQGATAAPTFYAYANAAQATTSGAQTKILFQVESWDTNNNFASSRFTPTVAGYYLLSSQLLKDGSPSRVQMTVYKNGGGANNEFIMQDFAVSSWVRSSGSVLLYANGSTDYFEIYGYQLGGTGFTYNNTSDTIFTGFLARSA